MSDSVWPQRWQPTRLPHPWASPAKNTGVGCHFLLQCMKVKVKSQSCPTLSDPMDCSLPGSSIHGIFQARVLEWVAIAFSNLGLLWWCKSSHRQYTNSRHSSFPIKFYLHKLVAGPQVMVSWPMIVGEQIAWKVEPETRIQCWVVLREDSV